MPGIRPTWVVHALVWFTLAFVMVGAIACGILAVVLVWP